MREHYREEIKDKKRIVVKVGTSSLIHPETGGLDLIKVERLVRELSDLHNQGRDVILVTSGAIGVGRKAAGLKEKPDRVSLKQACAAIGQARLMMIYQKFFAEYNQVAAQILMTRNTMLNQKNRRHAQDTFEELLELGAIPVVNANDSISTFEILHGDNDTLSAIVASLVEADLLILLSDIDGLYTDNPSLNPEAEFIPYVKELDGNLKSMGKDAVSGLGTGGMTTKLIAAELATSVGADMLIANGADMSVLHRIMDGQPYGTFFQANKDEQFDLKTFLEAHFS
ncbi:glutamate 5-kinase [Anaerosacchariphilus sp. NSJ-68]|uniref:Glutamate 5-kinase n=2 Tax=Lachnospiraceae TaxID=186803 RepID=A0A923LCW6_9FIRM|nr:MULTISPECIES: glutamate 5-kinase [Lachnospiraceae]MBC5659855.1 glutamate 5-kinase [Anaerosacchariphilus hominis]MBC5697522.1 glutamate 5-kinase [Roseburia difficilis]